MSDVFFWDMSEDNAINFDVNKVAEIATKSADADGTTVYFVTMIMTSGDEYIMAESVSLIQHEADMYGKMFAESLAHRIRVLKDN
jgi:hypothetical protein